jgi:hypothetical protein
MTPTWLGRSQSSCRAVNVQESAVYCPKNRAGRLAAQISDVSANSASIRGCVRIRASYSCFVSLAEQVLLSDTRKEAALDLHSPISTSHNKPIRQAD